MHVAPTAVRNNMATKFIFRSLSQRMQLNLQKQMIEIIGLFAAVVEALARWWLL
jgi:hypothetical protein